MTSTRDLEGVKTFEDDRESALREALFRPMGVDGIYARTEFYEHVLERLAAFINQYREQGTEVFRFPPVMSREDLERHGYLKSFPNLIACACALHGDEAQIHEAAARPDSGWISSLRATDLVLSPAACYPIYPIVAARPPVPKGGLIFDVGADCFRREPSRDLDRLQSFRMREFVCFGTAEEVATFRNGWMVRAREFADVLALPARIDQANDPFFGRIGRVRAAVQTTMALKFELLVPLRSNSSPTACMSFNAHRDHFGSAWGITTSLGQVAHSGCVAFGMDRLTLALFWVHGLLPSQWPLTVRQNLGL